MGLSQSGKTSLAGGGDIGRRKLPDCCSSSWQGNVILRFRTGHKKDFKGQYILYWAGERGREDSCLRRTHGIQWQGNG